MDLAVEINGDVAIALRLQWSFGPMRSPYRGQEVHDCSISELC